MKVIRIVIAVAIVCIFVTAIALIIASFESLESTEVGLRYNGTTKKLDESKLYTSGRHNIGPASNFKRYDTSIKTLEFDNIQTRTQDGLNINISVSYQYKLESTLDTLVKLFYSFEGDNYIKAYKTISENTFRDVCAQYTTYQFISERNSIQADLYQATSDALQNYAANVQNFQLLEIEYPSDFQDVITEAQNADLQIDQVENEKKTAESSQEGQIEAANTNKETLIDNAYNNAQQIVNTANAQASIIKQRINANKEGNQQFVNKLSYTTTELIEYQWGKSLNRLANNGIKIPMIFTQP